MDRFIHPSSTIRSMVSHEPKMDQMKRQAKTTRELHTKGSRKIRPRPVVRGPRLWPSTNSFLTPSGVSADPVDPPFVTLPILTNKQISVPANVFKSSDAEIMAQEHVTISHPDIPHSQYIQPFSAVPSAPISHIHPLPTHNTDSPILANLCL